MIPLTYNSQALYLLDDLPDWGSPFKATASLLTALESGLTDREARRAHGETLRLRLGYQIKASGAAARLLAGSLRAHQNEPVCAPLWPAACAWSDRASAEITGGLNYLSTWSGNRVLAADAINGSGISFNGGSGATLSGNPGAWGTADGTFACWVKAPTLPSANQYWCLTSGNSNIAIYLGGGPGGGSIGIAKSGITDFGTFPTYLLSANTWTHLAIVRSSSLYTLFVNGASVSTLTRAGDNFSGSTTTIACDAGPSSQPWAAQFCGWFHYNRALSAAEVAAHYAGKAPTSGLTCALDQFQSPTGTQLNDISGNGFHLPFTASMSWLSGVGIGAAASDTLVPLVVGYLETRDLNWITDTFATFNVSLVENSPNAWAITPAAYTAPAGPLPSGYGTAPRLFPFLTHWDGPRTGYTLRIAREEIGFGRQTSDVARAAAVARTVEQTAWASTADGWSAAKLLAFFSAHGAGASFWASGQQSAAVLASDLAAAATTATVTDTTGLVISDRLGLVQKGQLTGWVGPLTGIASPTLSFVSSGNAAASAATTSLVPLLLARFDSPKLDLEWITDGLATASFRVRELPPELALPAGETLGTTLGNLAPRAWLYEFTQTFPSATVVSRYTSYERDLTFGGNTYAAKKLTHGDIKTGLALDRDELSIDCDGLDIPTLLDVALLRSEVPLMLAVRRAEITGVGTAGNVTTAWSGEIAACAIKAKRIAAKAVALGSAFDRKAPRFYLQPGCNHGLFSVGCGLSSATFAHTATLTAVGTAGYPYTFTIGSLARAGGAVLTAADVFAGGWIEIGTGSALTRRAILASTAVSGSACVLTLSGDPAPFPTNGTAIVIYPGCDGRKETCASTFGNYLNFGGHPFVPTGNPSLFKLSSDAGSGGKK